MWEPVPQSSRMNFEEVCCRLINNDPMLHEVNCCRFTMGELLIDTLMDALVLNTVAKTLIVPLTFLTPSAAKILGARTKVPKIVLVRGENPETGDILWEFFRNASRSKTLTKVSLRGTRIDRQIAQALSFFLLWSRTIQELNLSRTGLHHALFRLIIGSIRNSPTLQSLDLSLNDLSHESMTQLFENFNGKLNFLDISYNIIGSAGLHSIAQYLTDRDANEFSLKMGPTSRLGMIVFVENLPLMKALTNLEITDASALDEEVWIAFQEGLKQNTSLESLCICEGEDAEGMVSSAVANALQENKHLRQLHITCSQTGVVGAYHLARALQLNSTLRVLNLEHNLLQDAGAITLSQHLVRMKGIEQLSLCENNVGFDGAVALLGGLQHNASLRMFNFGGNPGATKQLMDTINFRLRLNQLGTTELLLTDGTPLALWSLAVENLAKRNWLDVLYHLLGEKPILMKR